MSYKKNVHKGNQNFSFYPLTVVAHKKLIASFSIIIFVLISSYSLLCYTPQYTSQASVVIKDSALTAKYLSNDTYSTTTAVSANSVLNTMELLKSDLIAESVWRNVISKHPEEMKHLHINTLSAWKNQFGSGKAFIAAKNVPGTDVIYLSFKWRNAKIAKEGLESVLIAFQEASLKQNQAEHHQRYVYLKKQSDELQRQLTNLREQIAIYKKENKVYNIESTLSQYELNRGQIDNSFKMTQAEANNYRQQFAAYESSLGMNTKKAVAAVAIGRSSTLSALYAKRYELVEQKHANQTRYTSENPKMKQIDSELAQIDQNINDEIAKSGLGLKTDTKNIAIIADEARSQAVQDMLIAKARFEGAEAQTIGLRKSLGEIEAKMQKVPKIEATLLAMKQEESLLSKSLDAIGEKALDAQMREAQTLSNVFVVNGPGLPLKPVAPSRIQLILTGLLVGVAGGIAAAYVVDKVKLGTEASDRKPHLSLEELLEKERLNDHSEHLPADFYAGKGNGLS